MSLTCFFKESFRYDQFAHSINFFLIYLFELIIFSSFWLELFSGKRELYILLYMMVSVFNPSLLQCVDCVKAKLLFPWSHTCLKTGWSCLTPGLHIRGNIYFYFFNGSQYYKGSFNSTRPSLSMGNSVTAL